MSQIRVKYLYIHILTFTSLCCLLSPLYSYSSGAKDLCQKVFVQPSLLSDPVVDRIQHLKLDSTKYNSELVRAVMNGERSVDERDKDGNTLLHRAIFLQSRREKIQLLVKLGFHVNASNKEGDTPLNLAIQRGTSDQIKLLLDAGANPNIENKFGKNALYLAIEQASIRWMEMLIEAGANVNVMNKNKNTPLHHAIIYGTGRIVRFLIEEGANVHSRDFIGQTPLHLAATNYGTIEQMRFLIKAGADITSADQAKNTPLHLAAARGTPEQVEFLLKAEMRSARQKEDSSAEEIVPYIIQPSHQDTLSHLTVVRKIRSLSFVGYTLNKEGETPLDMAKKYRDKKDKDRVMQLLFNYIR